MKSMWPENIFIQGNYNLAAEYYKRALMASEGFIYGGIMGKKNSIVGSAVIAVWLTVGILHTIEVLAISTPPTLFASSAQTTKRPFKEQGTANQGPSKISSQPENQATLNATITLQKTLKVDDSVSSVAFSPDGQAVAAVRHRQ